MENAALLAPKQKTPLQTIEDNLQEETSNLVNIDDRLAQLLSRLRGSLPEGVSEGEDKACPQGTMGNLRERTETNQSIISRIQNQIGELEDIL